MTDLITLDFHGDELLLTDIDGKPFVIFRRVVEALGLDYSTQLVKLRGRSWANRRDIPTVGADGKTRLMVAISVPTMLMWLATVNESRVADVVRPKLIAYQSESSDAIYGYWTKGGAINPRATEEQLAAIIDRAERQARVLTALSGIVDPAWLESKARHVAARALGEEPEDDLSRRPAHRGRVPRRARRGRRVHPQGVEQLRQGAEEALRRPLREGTRQGAALRRGRAPRRGCLHRSRPGPVRHGLGRPSRCGMSGEYGPRPSNDPHRHPGGRTCRSTALTLVAVPVLLVALAVKALRRRRS